MSTTFKFEETSKFIENLNNLISLYKDSIGEEFQKDKNNFMVKYANKICLKRLSIAIFGKKIQVKAHF